MNGKSLKNLKKLREDLSKVRNLIADQAKLCDIEPSSFAYKLSLQSLEYHKEEIEQSIKAIEDEKGLVSLDLKFDSPEIAFGSIPLDILGNAMIGLQKVINSIAQALSSGPIERGPFSSEIIKSSQLQLSGIYPGSFGMYLDGVGEENMLGENLLKDSLNKFQEVLEIDDENEFVNQLEHLGFRTINTYKDWLCKLETSKVTVKVKFNNSTSNKSIVKTPEDMINIRKSLENIAEPKLEEISLVGVLVGGNIRNGNFEFSSNEQLISGKATTEVKEKFKDFHLGEEFKASFDKETFDGISKIVWVLKGIEKVGS